MKKFPALFLLVPLVMLFVAGCGGPNTAMVGLKVELTRVTRDSDGRTHVEWRVINPNIVPYLVARASHRIYLDDVLVGTLDDRDALAVPAQSKPERTGVITSAGAAGEAAVAKAAGAGSATYRLESVITIRLYGETTDKSDLKASGTVPVTAK